MFFLFYANYEKKRKLYRVVNSYNMASYNAQENLLFAFMEAFLLTLSLPNKYLLRMFLSL